MLVYLNEKNHTAAFLFFRAYLLHRFKASLTSKIPSSEEGESLSTLPDDVGCKLDLAVRLAISVVSVVLVGAP